MALVNEILDFKPANPDPFARSPDPSYCFCGRHVSLRSQRLSFGQSLNSPFQNLFRRTAGIAGELVFQKFFSMRCKGDLHVEQDTTYLGPNNTHYRPVLPLLTQSYSTEKIRNFGGKRMFFFFAGSRDGC